MTSPYQLLRTQYVLADSGQYHDRTVSKFLFGRWVGSWLNPRTTLLPESLNGRMAPYGANGTCQIPLSQTGPAPIIEGSTARAKSMNFRLFRSSGSQFKRGGSRIEWRGNPILLHGFDYGLSMIFEEHKRFARGKFSFTLPTRFTAASVRPRHQGYEGRYSGLGYLDSQLSTHARTGDHR